MSKWILVLAVILSSSFGFAKSFPQKDAFKTNYGVTQSLKAWSKTSQIIAPLIKNKKDKQYFEKLRGTETFKGADFGPVIDMFIVNEGGNTVVIRQISTEPWVLQINKNKVTVDPANVLQSISGKKTASLIDLALPAAHADDGSAAEGKWGFLYTWAKLSNDWCLKNSEKAICAGLMNPDDLEKSFNSVAEEFFVAMKGQKLTNVSCRLEPEKTFKAVVNGEWIALGCDGYNTGCWAKPDGATPTPEFIAAEKQVEAIVMGFARDNGFALAPNEFSVTEKGKIHLTAMARHNLSAEQLAKVEQYSFDTSTPAWRRWVDARAINQTHLERVKAVAEKTDKVVKDYQVVVSSIVDCCMSHACKNALFDTMLKELDDSKPVQQ